MTEAQFRNKIIWFSFVFSLLVVWVHSYNAELFLGLTDTMRDVGRLELWMDDTLGQIAVPGFFMISGYLFYRGFDWGKLREKWNRRIKSVLLPFILWNFIYYLGYVISSRLPWMTDVVGKGVIPFNLHAMVDAIINYTYNYVFWYLFQLILLILLAPVLYPVIRRGWSFRLLMAALWLVVGYRIDLPLVNADAMIYYAFAGRMALRPANPLCARRRGGQSGGQSENGQSMGGNPVECAGSRMRFLTGILLCILGAAAHYVGLRFAWIPGFVLCRLLVVAGLWTAVPGEKLPQAREFMSNNFFLYATHFAFVRFINKAGAMVLPVTKWEPFVLYLCMPFLVLAISTVLGKVLRRLAPDVWTLLNGGR